MLDFVAIDFETANQNRASACSVGAVVIKNGQITDTFYSLLKPHESCYWFDIFNTSIHGIEEDDVIDSPEFPDVWGRLSDMLNGSTLVAHNASFDCSVLRHILEVYGLTWPECKIACSCAISRRSWPELSSFSLDIVSEHLGIQLDHHHALDDAKASAQIVLAAARKAESTTWDDLVSSLSFYLGAFHDGTYSPSGASAYHRQHLTPVDLANPELNPDDFPLWGKNVVITGTLQSMVRDEAYDCIVKAGGSPQNATTKKTDFLVMGIQDYKRFTGGEESSKTKKAKELRSQGSAIEILSEFDFLNMLTEQKFLNKLATIKEEEQKEVQAKARYQKSVDSMQPLAQKALEITAKILNPVLDLSRLGLQIRGQYFSITFKYTLYGKEYQGDIFFIYPGKSFLRAEFFKDEGGRAPKVDIGSIDKLWEYDKIIMKTVMALNSRLCGDTL